MRSLCSRLTVAAAALALAVPVNASVFEFDFAPQAQPETVGTVRDMSAHAAEMRQLQQHLADRGVARGLRAPVVVELSPGERQLVDDVGRREMKYQVGVAKPAGIAVDFAATRGLGTRTAALNVGAARGTGNGGFVWTAAFRSPGATALRLHVTGLDLPRGAALYVYNEQGHAFGPYTGRGPLGDGVLHTNTVFGEQLTLQLEQPRGTARVPQLTVENVGVMGQRFTAPRMGPEDRGGRNGIRAMLGEAFCSYNASCVQNAACTNSSPVSQARDAVAGMLFQSGSGYYICTGGLVADTDTSTVIPYFLTANHCVGSSGEASSLETYFDYETTCNSPNCTQPYNSTGHTVGATILSTSSTSDYTLLRLSSTPSSPDGVTTYLGWTATAVANTNNLALYRISHPSGSPQAYSEHVVDTNKGTCRSWPRGNWIYSRDTYGATEGGSSGSPVVNAQGQIVGQLSGACGTNVNNNCDSTNNATVDGAFAAYYSKVSSWLNPGSGGGGGTCSPKGASCTNNSDCCSNKCGGKPGSKTCK